MLLTFGVDVMSVCCSLRHHVVMAASCSSNNNTTAMTTAGSMKNMLQFMKLIGQLKVRPKH